MLKFSKPIFVTALLIILALATGCWPRIDGGDSGSPTPEPIPVTAWGPAESAISEAILGTSAGKCEWEMLGWQERERYIWAFCQSGPGVDASGTGTPVVVLVNAGGKVESVLLPKEGKDFEIDVRRIFPPAVQEKILAQDFDLFAFMTHLELRWENSSLPPDIYATTRDLFPILGKAAVAAISAKTASRIIEKKTLGEGNIKMAQFLPDGQMLLTGDRGLGVWYADSGHFRYTYQWIGEGIRAFHSPDGKKIAVVEGNDISIYDGASRAIEVTINTTLQAGNIHNVLFLPDGMTLLVETQVPSERPVSATVGLYSLINGRMIKNWQPGGSNIVLSPNAQYLAGLYNSEGTAVWSIANTARWLLLPVVGSAASFSADGQILAVAELTNVKLYWVWDGFEIGRLQANYGHIEGVALSPDGKLILTWTELGDARLWTVPDFQLVDTFYIGAVSTAAFNPDGTEILLVGSWSIELINLEKGGTLHSPLAIYNQVTDLSFAPDRTFSQGQRLAAAYQPGPNQSLIVNWEVSTGEQLFVRSEYLANSLAYAPEPYGIALGTRDNTVMMIDAVGGHPLRTFSGPTSRVFDLAIDDSGHLAAGSLHEVRIYSLADSEEVKGRELPVGGGWVTELAWSCFLAAAVDDGNVHLYDENVEDKFRSIVMPTAGYEILLAVPPDCSQLFTAQAKSIYRIDAQTWENLPSFQVTERITALAVSQDGSLLAVGTNNGNLLLLDSQTGNELRSLKAHSGAVTALEFSPDGSVLASGGADGVVIIWGVE